MNYVSEVVFQNGKLIPARKLQPLVYGYLRNNIGLKSQVSCNIPRQVAGTYKTLLEQIQIKKAEWQKIVYTPSSMILSYKRDYTIKEDSVSITTFSGRKTYKIQNYAYAMQYFKKPWKFAASKVVKHENGDYYFHLTVLQEIEAPSIEKASNFMGVDVGINYLAVASTTDKNCRFFAGGEIKNKRNIYKNLRARLQAKGTLSAKRVLKRLSGKEQRFMKDVNHCISKSIVKFAVQENVSVIGLEDLTNIRDRTSIPKTRGRTSILKTRDRTNIPKKEPYLHNIWAFRQLQSFIEYKAKEVGILVEYINPEYTSQTCSRCNHISKNNRKRLTFHCEVCGFELNADLNGARNIEHRARDFRYSLESQGCLSTIHTNT